MIQKLLDFLLSLQHVSVGRHAHLAFGVSWSGWILLIAALLMALGWWSYRRQSATLQLRRAMGITRGVLLVLVFLLFCRPALVVEREDRQPSVVAVWVDSSASMQLEDVYRDAGMKHFVREAALGKKLPVGAGRERMNRYEVAVAALEHAAWLRELATTQHVAIFTGSGHAELVGTATRAEELPALLAQLNQVSPTGETTDVPTMLREMIEQAGAGGGARVSAAVLLTDGQTTEAGAAGGAGATEEMLATAERGGVKVFPLPLGEAEEPFDLKLTNLQLPENTFVRDPVAVRARLTGTGIAQPTPAKVTVYRKEGGTLTPLVSKEFTLEPDKKEMDVELIFKPAKKGDEKSERFDLVAKVEASGAGGPEELTLKNNEATGATNVLDAEVNVLYVDGYPRWEYRYLKNELIREKTVNVAALLVGADNDFAQEGDPREVDKEGRETFPGPISRFPETAEEMDKFDVVLIGDVDPAFFSPTQQKLIVDFVGKGGGIGWIAGIGWNPEGYKDTALNVLLPVVPDELDPRARVMAPPENAPFDMVLTAAGRESNLFKFFDDAQLNVDQMAQLPEMYWYKPVVGLAPAAEVLAVHPTRTLGGGSGTPAPLIVTGHYKRGRTFFSAVADTWRWRRYTGEPLFQSYWLQVCRLLYRNKALGQSRRLELTADSNRVEVGRPIKVMLEVRDPTLLGQMPEQVALTETDKAGRPIGTVTLSRSATSATQMEGLTTATETGDVTLGAPPGSLPAEVAPLEIAIEPPQREFEKMTADIDGMKILAAKTTGAVVPLDASEGLAKLIPDRSLTIMESESEELWYKPIALVLVIAAATIEWLLRKKAGLV